MASKEQTRWVAAALDQDRLWQRHMAMAEIGAIVDAIDLAGAA